MNEKKTISNGVTESTDGDDRERSFLKTLHTISVILGFIAEAVRKATEYLDDGLGRKAQPPSEQTVPGKTPKGDTPKGEQSRD